MGIYLDHAATSFPKPPQVCSAIIDFMRDNGASPGRGNYAKAQEADLLLYHTRKALCKLFNAKRPSEIIFTANATEALNLALKGILKPGARVLTTSYEHNAMWRPLKKLQLDRGIHVVPIPSLANGQMELSALDNLLAEPTDLIAVCHASNVLGCITPLDAIVSVAQRYNVPVLVDAAQTAGVYPIDLQQTPVDMLAFTGHKGLLGPTGTGGLYIKSGLLPDTLKEGGTGSMSASPFQPDDPPDRYESGTINICGLAGLYAAVQYILENTVATIRCHEQHLMDLLMDGLPSVPGLRYCGPENAIERVGLVCFTIEGCDPNHLATQLDTEYGIMARAGLHCAPCAHNLAGTDSTGAVRVSIGYTTGEQDIFALLDALKQISA